MKALEQEGWMARWYLISERMVVRWEGLRVGKDTPCRVPPLLYNTSSEPDGRCKEERVLDEKIHEPAKRKSSHDHDQEEGEAVADLRFFLVSSNQGQNGRDKS